MASGPLLTIALVLAALSSSSNAQFGQSPFLPRYRPCPCVEACIYEFEDPKAPNFILPSVDDLNAESRLNIGNPLAYADGSPVTDDGCEGDSTSYLNDQLEWIPTITDAEGEPRSINAFAIVDDALINRGIGEDLIDSYLDEVAGRLVRTDLVCNNGDRGCVYYTIEAPDFMCPCPIDIELDLTMGHEMLGGIDVLEPTRGSGSATIQFNPVLNLFQWEIELEDLSSDLMQIHFHGAASPIETAPIQINATDVAPPLGLTGNIVLDDDQARQLVDGMWYINIHTELNPAGELRGNIRTPDLEIDCTAGHEMLGGVEILEPTEGSGVAFLNYDRDTRLLSWSIEVDDLTSDVVQLHLHRDASPIETGPVIINMTEVGVPPLGMIGATTLSLEEEAGFESGFWYINIHTEDNPSGELRGNIKEPDTTIGCNVEQESAAGIEVIEDSDGEGRARLSFDTDSRLLVWDVRTFDLAGDLLELHFHGPARTTDIAEIVINATDVGVPPFGTIGAATLTPQQAQELQTELWYIDIHTTVNPNGELRGNIVAAQLDGPFAVTAGELGVNVESVFPVAAIVVIVVGGVCIIFVSFLIYRSQKKKKRTLEFTEEFENPRGPNTPRRLSGTRAHSQRSLAGLPKRPESPTKTVDASKSFAFPISKHTPHTGAASSGGGGGGGEPSRSFHFPKAHTPTGQDVQQFSHSTAGEAPVAQSPFSLSAEQAPIAHSVQQQFSIPSGEDTSLAHSVQPRFSIPPEDASLPHSVQQRFSLADHSPPSAHGHSGDDHQSSAHNTQRFSNVAIVSNGNTGAAPAARSKFAQASVQAQQDAPSDRPGLTRSYSSTSIVSDVSPNQPSNISTIDTTDAPSDATPVRRKSSTNLVNPVRRKSSTNIVTQPNGRVPIISRTKPDLRRPASSNDLTRQGNSAPSARGPFTSAPRANSLRHPSTHAQARAPVKNAVFDQHSGRDRSRTDASSRGRPANNNAAAFDQPITRDRANTVAVTASRARPSVVSQSAAANPPRSPVANAQATVTVSSPPLTPKVPRTSIVTRSLAALKGSFVQPSYLNTLQAPQSHQRSETILSNASSEPNTIWDR